jgi:hypothetical protein
MKIISHRGNLNGPLVDRENDPLYIDEAIALGFDVEVDVRLIDDKVYLGHDDPDHEVSLSWLFERRYNLWIHCKNLEAAYGLSGHLRCFCSESDPFCFITQGFLWLNDVTIEPKINTVVPLLGIDDIKDYNFMGKPWGVCTDYPMEIK